MEELTSDKDSFIQALLVERDRLFQENSRLRSKQEAHTDVELLKSSYEETISHQKTKDHISGTPGCLSLASHMGQVQ